MRESVRRGVRRRRARPARRAAPVPIANDDVSRTAGHDVSRTAVPSTHDLSGRSRSLADAGWPTEERAAEEERRVTRAQGERSEPVARPTPQGSWLMRGAVAPPAEGHP